MKKKILFTLSVLAAGFVCFCIWMVSGIGSDAYYTQIDNTQLEEVSSQGGVFDLHGGLPYPTRSSLTMKRGRKRKLPSGQPERWRRTPSSVWPSCLSAMFWNGARFHMTSFQRQCRSTITPHASSPRQNSPSPDMIYFTDNIARAFPLNDWEFPNGCWLFIKSALASA